MNQNQEVTFVLEKNKQEYFRRNRVEVTNIFSGHEEEIKVQVTFMLHLAMKKT